MGGVNFLPLNNLSDICQVTHGLRLIHSKDIHKITMKLLKANVKKRIKHEPNNHEIAEYLNGSMEKDFKNETTDITNSFTKLRIATKSISKKIDVQWAWAEDKLNLKLNGNIINPNNIEYTLRQAMHNLYANKLMSKPDQGKAFKTTSTNKASNHFLNNGSFTRFAN